MKKICEKCGREVPEKEIIEIGVELVGGQTLEPQIFEHKNCGGEILIHEESDCRCTDPLCAKCLGVNCQDDNCPIHTKEHKALWRKKKL